MNIIRLLFAIILASASVYAQQGNNVSGFVKDVENGEAVIDAHLINTESKKGVTTNNYGYFSMPVTTEKLKLSVSHIGYQAKIIDIELATDTILEIVLERNTEIEEVVVAADYYSHKTDIAGTETLDAKMVNSLPAIMGEPDIIKAVNLLPGVSFGNEAASGYFVRGSSSDQNLVLIDGVPLYNPFHLYGYFSALNTDAVNKATLYKGAVLAKYGGRLASVLDINMQEGNSKHYSGKLSIGNVTAKAMLQGPLIKDKTSFLITGRRSMLDIFNKDLSNIFAYFSGMTTVASNMDVTNYYFYDFNAKVNHKFNNKHRLYFNFYKGKDKYNNQSNRGFLDKDKVWGNTSASVRWNQVYSNSLFSNLTAYYSEYKYNDKDGLTIEDTDTEAKTAYSIKYNTSIQDYSLKDDFNYNYNNHYLKFGGQYVYQKVSPAVSMIKMSLTDSDNIDTTLNSGVNTHYAIAYFDDTYTLNKKLLINAGLRFLAYFADKTFYPSLQPRLSLNYTPFENLTLKTSYTRMVQPLHVLANSWSGDPSDIWVPSTAKVKPENSNQLSAGISYKLRDVLFETEVFAKNMNHLIDYKEGASYFNTQTDWQDKIETGTAKAWGMEFSAKKKSGKLKGTLSYTWLKSTREFKNINKGQPFPYTYERRHSITTMLMYKINKKWSVGANWVFATGQPLTIATQKATLYMNRKVAFKLYDATNNVRMPYNYHRLDFCLNYTKKLKTFDYKISVGAYNAYNRRNPYSILSFNESIEINSLLGISPYITLTLGF